MLSIYYTHSLPPPRSFITFLCILSLSMCGPYQSSVHHSFHFWMPHFVLFIPAFAVTVILVDICPSLLSVAAIKTLRSKAAWGRKGFIWFPCLSRSPSLREGRAGIQGRNLETNWSRDHGGLLACPSWCAQFVVLNNSGPSAQMLQGRSGLGPPTSITDCQSSASIFSARIFSFQMILVCVKLIKSNHNSILQKNSLIFPSKIYVYVI